MDVSGYPKSLIDASEYLILVEFSGIVKLIDFSGFFKFQFRVKAVSYRAFLLVMGGGK